MSIKNYISDISLGKWVVLVVGSMDLAFNLESTTYAAIKMTVFSTEFLVVFHRIYWRMYGETMDLGRENLGNTWKRSVKDKSETWIDGE